MSMLRPLPALVLCAAACTLPGYEGFTSFEPEGGSTTGTPPTPDDPPTTGNGIQTVTGADPGTSSGDGSTGLDETTGEPLPPPPAILGHTLSPNPLTELGTIAVTIVAEHAEGVRMQVDGGDPVELTPAPEGFTGGIPIYSGLSTGPHHATFVAWRGDQQSEPTQVPFEVALPPPGEGYVWESANLLGIGTVAAVTALPGDEGAAMVELGTYYPGGAPRCYLRRRDALGAWGPNDLVELHPGTDCSAIDIETQPDGTIYVLASLTKGKDPQWWLGRIGSWAAAATPDLVSQGGLGDVAHALAVSADRVAVCGTHPVFNPIDKLDAAVWVVGEPVKFFDYKTPELDPHTFDETVRDCIFDGQTLVSVGDAYGVHSNIPAQPNRRRHLQLRLDLESGTFTPFVAPELGSATQSVASAVALDGLGRVVTVGHVCEDTCKQDAVLWAHAPDGTLEWYTFLGADIAAPFALAWAPAGYVVLGGAVKKGPVWSSFWMRAYFIDDYEPVWTFERDDAPVFQYATAVGVSPQGHLYGGGVGANGYPAVVYLHP